MLPFLRTQVNMAIYFGGLLDLYLTEDLGTIGSSNKSSVSLFSSEGSYRVSSSYAIEKAGENGGGLCALPFNRRKSNALALPVRAWSGRIGIGTIAGSTIGILYPSLLIGSVGMPGTNVGSCVRVEWPHSSTPSLACCSLE